MPKAKKTRMPIIIGLVMAIGFVGLAYWLLAPFWKRPLPADQVPVSELSPVSVPMPKTSEPPGPPPRTAPIEIPSGSIYAPPTTPAGIPLLEID